MTWLVTAILALLLPAGADTVRLGLFVGSNVGFGQDEVLSSAEDEARDFAHVFHEMGDFSRDRTVVLTGPTAVQLRGAMVQAEAQAREAAARGDDVLLLFYYSGHASSATGSSTRTSIPSMAACSTTTPWPFFKPRPLPVELLVQVCSTGTDGVDERVELTVYAELVNGDVETLGSFEIAAPGSGEASPGIALSYETRPLDQVEVIRVHIDDPGTPGAAPTEGAVEECFESDSADTLAPDCG